LAARPAAGRAGGGFRRHHHPRDPKDRNGAEHGGEAARRAWPATRRTRSPTWWWCRPSPG
jgi:hypothetical protein